MRQITLWYFIVNEDACMFLNQSHLLLKFIGEDVSFQLNQANAGGPHSHHLQGRAAL